MDCFIDSRQHLLAELERIDLLIRARVAYARKLQAADEPFQGLYISEQEVDALLRQPLGRPGWVACEEVSSGQLQAALERLDRQIDRRKQQSLRQGIELRLNTLEQLFQLDGFERDALLICMAVELELRYERLYAYLQDDVTRKKPSVDLVLNLLLPTVEGKLQGRRYFSPAAPLLRHSLLTFSHDPAQPDPPLPARPLRMDPRMAEYLLGDDQVDERIGPYVVKVEPRWSLNEVALESGVKRGLSELGRGMRTLPRLVHLEGPYGAGKQSVAEAVCRAQGLKLLVVDLERLAWDGERAYAKTLALIDREARLQPAALYWKNMARLPGEHALRSAFLQSLESGSGLAFLAAGETAWEPAAARRAVTLRIALPRPGAAERSRLWSRALDGSAAPEVEPEVGSLAARFKFTPGQIQDAAATAENLARWREPENPRIVLKDLYEACRLHSNQQLSTLARKITPIYRWGDIVLPADRLAQLREICNHMKYRERVYEDWGFAAKLALGKGLSVLFAGPSGTGKTMAADIMAGELGLDLYKIDLATVVSKYIGETEKNLARIFAEAETANAILFFDEADALFGKRSEVKDSHDRYANIEIGYLLQRMEEYEGVVILATNLRKNMDEAFVRRLHFTVEFPFPDAADRRRIWAGIWPEHTPRDPSLDLEFMARRFEITGGSIRNIALAAAFLAADNGGLLGMEQLLHATRREYQKMGKVIADGDFGKPASLGTAQ